MPRPRQLDDVATLRMDFRAGDRLFAVTLGGDRTLADPLGIQAGETYTLVVTQDRNGGHVLTYGSAFQWGTAGPAPVDTAPNAVDVLEFLSPDGVRLVPKAAPRLTGASTVPLTVVAAVSAGQAVTKGQLDAGLAGVSAAGLADGDKGDVVVSSLGTVWTVDARAVTAPKMFAAGAASRLLGRGAAAGGGDWQELTLAASLALTGTALGVGVLPASGVTDDSSSGIGGTQSARNDSFNGRISAAQATADAPADNAALVALLTSIDDRLDLIEAAAAVPPNSLAAPDGSLLAAPDGSQLAYP